MGKCVLCHNSGLNVFGEYCRCEYGDWKKTYELKIQYLNNLGELNAVYEVTYTSISNKQENDDFRDSLIDLALQTKDEEWFKQLTRGME